MRLVGPPSGLVDQASAGRRGGLRWGRLERGWFKQDNGRRQQQVAGSGRAPRRALPLPVCNRTPLALVASASPTTVSQAHHDPDPPSPHPDHHRPRASPRQESLEPSRGPDRAGGDSNGVSNSCALGARRPAHYRPVATGRRLRPANCGRLDGDLKVWPRRARVAAVVVAVAVAGWLAGWWLAEADERTRGEEARGWARQDKTSAGRAPPCRAGEVAAAGCLD